MVSDAQLKNGPRTFPVLTAFKLCLLLSISGYKHASKRVTVNKKSAIEICTLKVKDGARVLELQQS